VQLTHSRLPVSYQLATPLAAAGAGTALVGGVHPAGGTHCSRAGVFGHGPAIGWAAPEPPCIGHFWLRLGFGLDDAVLVPPVRLAMKLPNMELSDGGPAGGAAGGGAGAAAGAAATSRSPRSYQLVTGFVGGFHPGGGVQISRTGVLGHGPANGCAAPEPPFIGQFLGEGGGAGAGEASAGGGGAGALSDFLLAFMAYPPPRKATAAAMPACTCGSFKLTAVDVAETTSGSTATTAAWRGALAGVT